MTSRTANIDLEGRFVDKNTIIDENQVPDYLGLERMLQLIDKLFKPVENSLEKLNKDVEALL